MGFYFFYIKVIGQPVKISPIGKGYFEFNTIFETNRWIAKHTSTPLNENPAKITLIWDLVSPHSLNKTSFIEFYTKLTPNIILN